MRTLVEVAVFLVVVTVFISAAATFLVHRRPSAPDKCEHKRWSKWKIEKTQPIHTYFELDEGRGLPDRVDAFMTRECLRCGTPQAKTLRGIDSANYK